MNKLSLSALVVGGVLFGTPSLANNTTPGLERNHVISYLTSWGLSGDALEQIRRSNVDTFLLSFGNWDANGNIQGSAGAGWIAPKYDSSWMMPDYTLWTQIKFDQPKKKMLLAFGGQNDEAIWSHITTPESRERVATGLVNLLRTGFPVYKKNMKPEEMDGPCLSASWNGSCNMANYQKAGTVYLDGIDFDFEKAARLTEKENDDLLKLVERIRQLLGPNSNKLLSLTTYHVGADPAHCDTPSDKDGDCSYVEAARSSHNGEVVPVLTKGKHLFDFFNVMAYDAGKDFRYKVALRNYAKALGGKSKIILGATINKQWSPDGGFVESQANNNERAEWQAGNGYGGFFVWTLGASTESMSIANQVDYINHMKALADTIRPPSTPDGDDHDPGNETPVIPPDNEPPIPTPPPDNEPPVTPPPDNKPPTPTPPPDNEPPVTPPDTGTPSAPTWNAGTAYTGGQKVSWKGVIYTAKWWTQGQDPEKHHTPNSADPWDRGGAATVPPVTPNPPPVTPNPPDDNTPNPPSTSNTWDRSKIYNANDTVVWKGATYRAKWWTQGDDPEEKHNAYNGDPWEKR